MAMFPLAVFPGDLTGLTGCVSLGPHRPSFHTNSGGRQTGKVARAMSATQTEDTPWPGPTVQEAKSCGYNMIFSPPHPARPG